MEIRRRATERHLPYGITQCYLSPDTGERSPPYPQPSRSVQNIQMLQVKFLKPKFISCRNINTSRAPYS